MSVRGLLLVLLSACSLDESGLGTGADAGQDVVVKDVTILDVAIDDGSGDAIVDAPPDVPPPPCNPTAAFANPTALGVVNTGAYEANPMLTNDELTIFFTRGTGGQGLALFHTTRATTSQPFGNATQLSLSTSQTIDTSPWVDDKLTTLLFASVRDPDKHLHLYQATGNGSFDGWTNITKLLALDALEPLADLHPWMAPASGEVWFASDRQTATGLDLYVAFGTQAVPSNYAALNTIAAESHPVLTADALTIFFARDDNQSKSHVFVSTRTSTSALFGTATQLTAFDQAMTQSAPGWISQDGCRMYFTTDRSGAGDIWMATRGS